MQPQRIVPIVVVQKQNSSGTLILIFGVSTVLILIVAGLAYTISSDSSGDSWPQEYESPTITVEGFVVNYSNDAGIIDANCQNEHLISPSAHYACEFTIDSTHNIEINLTLKEDDNIHLYTLTSANYENFVQKENFQKIDGMWKWYTESIHLEGELDAGTYYFVLYNHEL
jgi:hypothetical protein